MSASTPFRGVLMWYSCIAYVLNIRKYWRLPISQAYARGVEEFVRLRARHEMATMAAEMEARNHGADFLRDPYVRPLPTTPS